MRAIGVPTLVSARRARSLAVGAATAAIVVAANASQGAYFSQSWGWVALAFLVPTTVLLLLERVTVPGRLRTVFLAAVGSLALWVALSALWSVSPAGSIREFERMLVYVGVALALTLVARRGDEISVLTGALGGITLVSGYALATRLIPDRFHTFADPDLPYRLAAPIGYWNALGLLATMGIVLALGQAAHARRTLLAAAAAATTPILIATLYFTFSRGAWGALVVGLVCMTAFDSRRFRLFWTALVISPAAVLTVVIASRQEALTRQNALPADWERAGHRLALVVLGLMACSALAASVAHVISRRVAVSFRSRRAFDGILIAVAAGAIVGSLVAVGGPVAGASELRRSFDRDPVADIDLNARLFSASGNGRSEQLRVSWEAGKRRLVTGNGAGSFEYLWYERRPNTLVVRDGHSLYLDTFAELGVVGLGLLGLVLIPPFVAGFRARRSRFVAAGVGALAAWAAAATLDWHWEVVGVTMTALLAGGICLAAAERQRWRPLPVLGRVALGVASVILSVFAVVSLVGNQALFAGREALAREDWADAREQARRADALLPWSFEPKVVLGDAYAGLGDREAALGSYRDAVEIDPRNWVVWLRLAQVASGPERKHAYAEVRKLNPREEVLPGEDVPMSG